LTTLCSPEAVIRYTRRTKSSGNVFIDLGFDPAEAKVMALRAEVMIRIEQHLRAQGWTQAEAAKRLGITTARIATRQGQVAGLQPRYAADASLLAPG
jgi:predicted XRE-type DNA-binding protein